MNESQTLFEPEKEKVFNLIDEPWIKVVRSNEVKELSIREFFDTAHEYSQISGDLSLQDFAVFRVLSAVYRSAVTNSHGILEEEFWKSTWKEGRFDTQMISEYLDDEDIYDRFWLFHPTRPFYQVADLTPIISDKVSKIQDIVIDVPKDKALMTFLNADEKYIDGMSFPEAARWIVTSINYDVAGPHTGTVGDPRVATSGGGKNKSYTKKTALSLISGIQIIGDNLFETIMLNNIPMSIEEELDADFPIWETDEPMTNGPLYEINEERTKPGGILQLLTWPSRRARLLRDQDSVTKYIITHGDSFEPIDTHRLEAMSSYKPGEEEGTLSPFVQSSDSHFWRGYDSLLQLSTRYHQPMNVAFLGDMRVKGVIDNKMYRVAVITARYDVSMSSKITDAIYEVNPLPAKIIGDPIYEGMVINALEVIEKARKSFWSYGINSSLSSIDDDVVAKEKAQSSVNTFLDRCESVFYDWLESTASGEYDHPEEEIINKVEKLLNDLADENESRTKDPSAFIGTIDDNGKSISLISARNIMIGGFRKHTRNLRKDN